MPLSQEGYADIIASIKKCEEFRTKRLQSIDRFAVDDPRTPEQIEEEEAIVKRLKQAYKLAKINAAKRKEHNKDRDDKIDEEEEDEPEEGANSSQAAATKGSAVDASPKKGRKQSTIMEAQNEDEAEDEDDPEQFSDDEDNGEVIENNCITIASFNTLICIVYHLHRMILKWCSSKILLKTMQLLHIL